MSIFDSYKIYLLLYLATFCWQWTVTATRLAPGRWPVTPKTRHVTVSPGWVVWSVTNVSLATGAWTLRLAVTTRQDVPVWSRAHFFFLFLSHIPIALYLHDKIWSLWVIFPNFPFQVATVISLVQIAQIVTKIMANVCVTMGSKVTIVRFVKQTILLCPLMCVEQKVWTKIEIE